MSASTASVASPAAQALGAAVADDVQAALQRLVYVDDTMPGWRRVKRGDSFEYQDEQGQPIRDENELRRIQRLAIPPAYTDLWICPSEHGHIQAVGRDARGRKQYRYHELWQLMRDVDKFERMRDFGLALPRIRRAVERDLALPGLPRQKVLATIVRLLDTTYLRVGNDEYARQNGSYGLTTLRDRHARIQGSRLVLAFRGKSGVQQRVQVNDARLARIVRKSQELPGQELFQYVDDEDGSIRSIGSADVNDYLRSLTEGEFTAKDFRTWHASALALEQLHPCEADSAKEAKARIKEVIAEVAKQLGHTVTVCRKSYVHPHVLQHFIEGRLQAVCATRGSTPGLRGLKESERRLLALLGGGGAASAGAVSAASRPAGSRAQGPSRNAPRRGAAIPARRRPQSPKA